MEKNENGYYVPVLPSNKTNRSVEDGQMEISLAMVYSPYQYFHGLYEPGEALKKGTLFEDLYKPLRRGDKNA